ncbi:alpha/beta hydrolase [Candidatus Woesebacteria bacterium]|nr:alpha/beta hydrolase [Candidatus Woesebacteria bacterium]
MKKLFFLLLVLLTFLTGWSLHSFFNPRQTPESPISQLKPRPLDQYTIENLAKVSIPTTKIEIGERQEEEKEFSSYLFSISFDPTLSGREEKKVTGLINIPAGVGPFPLVVMFRGYADQEIYRTGLGTQKAAEYFARNGFISLAPDFLGYGGSDSEAENIFESRFQTYITALTLLESLETIEGWDSQNVFIWGHSNGGQIAMSLLEITGRAIPTTLWAPVSKPFPYSVLYYTDESEDRGKLIRRELADFEQTYDPDLYAIDLYYERIKAPLTVHQGTNDDAVPRQWSDELTKKLNELEIDFDYFVYPGADHNLNPAWNTVVARDLAFFNKYL